MEDTKECGERNPVERADVQKKAEKSESNEAVMDGQVILNFDFSRCYFCSKMFYDSIFMMRHLLRRHSEDIVSLHQQLCDANTSNIFSSHQKNLINFFSKELLKFKKDLEEVKQSVFKENDTISTVSTEQEDSEANESTSTLNIEEMDEKYLINFFCEELFKLRDELLAIKQFIFKREKSADIPKKSSEQNVISKEGESSKGNASESDLKNFINSFCEELLKLREELELIKQSASKKNVLPKDFSTQTDFNEANKFSSESHTEEMAKMCDKVDSLLISISIQEERMYQSLLEFKSVTEKWEENFLDIKSRLEKLENLISLNSEMVNSKITEEVEKKFEHDIQVFLDDNKAKKEKKQIKSSKNVNAPQSVKENKIRSISVILEEKLKALNISSETQRLSFEDYEKKMRLVQSEAAELSKKYKSFIKNRKHFNLLAAKETFQRIKGRKKVRFQEKDEIVPLMKEKEDGKNLPAAHLLNETYEPGPSTSKVQFDSKKVDQSLNDVQNSAASFKVIHRPGILKKKQITPTLLTDLNVIDYKSSDSE